MQTDSKKARHFADRCLSQIGPCTVIIITIFADFSLPNLSSKYTTLVQEFFGGLVPSFVFSLAFSAGLSNKFADTMDDGTLLHNWKRSDSAGDRLLFRGLTFSLHVFTGCVVLIVFVFPISATFPFFAGIYSYAWMIRGKVNVAKPIEAIVAVIFTIPYWSVVTLQLLHGVAGLSNVSTIGAFVLTVGTTAAWKLIGGNDIDSLRLVSDFGLFRLIPASLFIFFLKDGELWTYIEGLSIVAAEHIGYGSCKRALQRYS